MKAHLFLFVLFSFTGKTIAQNSTTTAATTTAANTATTTAANTATTTAANTATTTASNAATTTAETAATTTSTPVTTTPPTTTTTTPTPAIKPSPLNCNYGNNTLGTCECNGQLFVAHNCHSGFFCLFGEDGGVDIDGVTYQGCEVECAEDETLVVSPLGHASWDCHKTNDVTSGLLCPGKFNSECHCNPDDPEENSDCDFPVNPPCTCPNQVWIAHDCHDARICDKKYDGGYEDINCDDNQDNKTFISVNLITHEWHCIADNSKCLGTFHVGCEDDVDPTDGTSGLAPSVVALGLAALGAFTFSLL